ncbi:MAG: Hsp33 family molecular chaperone HslO [Deltaproteobacteria bacterium]|nr:Hsp33 family molecular chaperone HslO [Deltaproteobacteria bacterium]
MADQVLLFAAPQRGLVLAVACVPELTREAAQRHQLAPGSAATLAQGLCGTLLLAATDRPDEPAKARVDLQLDCPGPLRGLFVDANGLGQVRGMVRVGVLDREGARTDAAAPVRDDAVRPVVPAWTMQVSPHVGESPLRVFSARPLLSSAHDDQAGMLMILRADPGADDDQNLHRAMVPFAGSDLGAGLSAYLRADRRLPGELAVGVLYSTHQPLAAVGGAMVLPVTEDDLDTARAVGETLRIGALAETLERAEKISTGNAHALAQEIADQLSLGPLRLDSEVRARFMCRCSREKVVNALARLGAPELRDMAGKDGGAEATCDFCAHTYVISAEELLELASAA